MEEGALVDGRFRVIAPAGHGAFGTVYCVVDEQTHKKAALKVFDRPAADFARFEREAELLATIRHPQIVEFVAHGFTESGTAYLAMEWLAGSDLAETLRLGPLSRRDALYLALRAAEGLAAAHAQGVLHRDIKPSNLFLVDNQPDQVRLLDFGIARKAEDATQLTQTGAVLGTPGYMAPEQALGVRELTARVDVFALGCVLFECLTGAPVFVGPSVQAVLAKIVSEPVPRLSHWMPSIPAGVDALLARMMARDPFDRFPDAAAMVLAISDVIADPSLRPMGGEGPAVSTERARTTSSLLVESEQGVAQSAVRLMEAFGGQIQEQGENALLATFGLENAPETAKRTVLCALALVSGDNSLRAVALSSRDRAAVANPGALLFHPSFGGVAPESGRVLVDRATASLLGQSFQLRRDGTAAWVIAHLPTPPRSADVHLGRARELAILDGVYSEVTEEHCARVVVVNGPAGIGKSRLLQAAADRLAAREPPPTILWAQADAPTGASPFELVRIFVRSRLHALLEPDGEGVHFIDALVKRGMTKLDAESLFGLASPHTQIVSKVYVDPLVLSDRIRCAWLSFVDMEVGAAPLVLVSEDIHLADAASIRLLSAALEQMPDRSILVVASTRAEEDTSWDSLRPEKIRLQSLRPQVGAELVRALRPDLEPRLVEQIVERAAGNPMRLRELVRASSELHGDEGFDAGFDARVSRLPPSASRAVRCGSVFGLRFTAASVAHLLGQAVTPLELETSLSAAVEAEVLRELQDPSGEKTFVFTHALLQEAAYSQLPRAELKAAHRAAGTALAKRRGADPSVIAWHFERAEEQQLALPWFTAAARAALVGGEPARALHLADEALKCATEPDDVVGIMLLRADSAFALADTTEGSRAAEAALSRARPGSLAWVRAASILANCAGQRGDNDTVARLGNAVLGAEPDTDAEPVRVVCLCQVTTQLMAAGRRVEAEFFGSTVSRSSSARPEAEACVAHLEAAFAFRVSDLERAAQKLDESARLHALSGNLRASALLRIFRSSALLYAGDCEAAAAELDAADGLSRRTGADYYVRWARFTRGKILALTGDPWAAREHLQSVRGDLAGNPRIVAGTHIYAALAALRAADGDWAEAEARLAMNAHQTPPIQAVARAALARAKVLQKQSAEALEHATQAKALLASLGVLDENESIVHLALPEALEACGRPDDARPLAEAALNRLLAIASKFSNLSLREAFLNENSVHAATLQLAHRLGLPIARDDGRGAAGSV